MNSAGRLAVRILIFSVGCLLAASRGIASGDTLVVFASGPDLGGVIMGDTASNGARLHHAYRLVSCDTTYLSGFETIAANFSISILGVPDPVSGKLPTIQQDPASCNCPPADRVFTLTGNGMTATFKNLYLLGLGTNGVANQVGGAIRVVADSVRLIVSNVVFEEWLGFAVGYTGNWDSFFIVNCKFRNMNHPNQWYVGEALRNEWPGTVYTDSIVMRNNTFFCINGYVACPVTRSYERYFEFSHNNVIYTFKNPLFIFNVTTAKIDDNIFYANYVGGVNANENPGWDNLWYPDSDYGLIALEPLSHETAKFFSPGDSTSSLADSLAEGRRTIEVRNNVWFWPPALTKFWHDWNDTAHFSLAGDSIRTPTWMNRRTAAMFADKRRWPGLVQSGNQNVDPGFGASIMNVLDNTGGGDGIGLIPWFVEARRGIAGGDVWGYQLTRVATDVNWTPAWPLQESGDMRYAYTSLRNAGTDGGPIGDTFWWYPLPATGVRSESGTSRQSFSLYQNFPNPFNPSTTIRYRLQARSPVALTVYNTLGQGVAVLINRMQEGGYHEVRFEGAGLASGVYFYRLRAGEYVETRSFVLLR